MLRQRWRWLPASGPGGQAWYFSRAELPHSLPSELRAAARGGERMTLASYAEHLIRLLVRLRGRSVVAAEQRERLEFQHHAPVPCGLASEQRDRAVGRGLL